MVWEYSHHICEIVCLGNTGSLLNDVAVAHSETAVQYGAFNGSYFFRTIDVLYTRTVAICTAFTTFCDEATVEAHSRLYR